MIYDRQQYQPTVLAKTSGQENQWEEGQMADTVPCTGTATGTVPTSVPCSNIQESVAKVTSNLTQITALFSPQRALWLFFSQHPSDGQYG